MANLAADPFASEIEAINRRRQIAQALQQQAIKPMGTQMAGNIAIKNSPLQGIAQIASALMAKKGMEEADAQQKDVVAQAGARRSADMSLLANALGGQQASPGGPMEDASGNVTVSDPVKALSPAQAVHQALPMIQDPQLQQFGLQAAQQAQTRQDDREFRTQEAQAARLARSEEVMRTREAQERAAAVAREDRADRERRDADLRRELAAGSRENARAIADAANQTRRDIAAENAAARGDKPLTETQGNAVLFGSRAALAARVLDDLEGDISTTGLEFKRGLQNMPVVGGALGAAANAALSDKQQQVEQAQRDFVNAVLRKESGANIAPSEFDNAVKQYFPAPGDSEKVKNQKRQNRLTAITGLRSIAGQGGSSQIDDIVSNTPRLTEKKDKKPGAPLRRASDIDALLERYAPRGGT